jgi:hypothetical protein
MFSNIKLNLTYKSGQKSCPRNVSRLHRIHFRNQLETIFELNNSFDYLFPEI